MESLEGKHYFLEVDSQEVVVGDLGVIVMKTHGALVKAFLTDEEGNIGRLFGSLGSLGELSVDLFEVDVEGCGMGTYLFSKIVGEFDIEFTKSYLRAGNYKCFAQYFKNGLCVEESLLEMPSVKVRRRAGFENFEFEFLCGGRIYMEAWK